MKIRFDLRNSEYCMAFAVLMVVGLAFSLSACGDDVTEVTEIHQDGMAILENGKKLSKEVCDSTNVGDMLFVMDSSAAFICDGKSWQTLKGADGAKGNPGKDGDSGVSCEIQAVENGYKILCGGDSVGVVKNGENGKPGEAGASCSVAPIKDGYKVVCDGDSVGVVKNGENGKPGDAGESAYELSGSELPEEEWVNSLKGDSGVSCEAKIAKNAGGLEGVEVSCGGIVVDTIWNGEVGKDGNSAYEIAVQRGFKGTEDEWMERVVYPNLWDKRDGKIYRTVRIGSQVWMAENLNYEYVPENDEDIGESWCIDDSQENCDKYGRLYNWAAANKVCPEGWHLPSNKEWDTFLRPMATKVGVAENGETYYDGADEKLKSTDGWPSGMEGDDFYGFSVLPAGTVADNISYGIVSQTLIWSSDSFDEENAYYVYVQYDLNSVILRNTSKKYGESVRCLKGIIKEN